jgi:hypothetical protein
LKTYEEFLNARAQSQNFSGFEPTFNPDAMFPFQHDLHHWAQLKGRAAVFADCGMGKTLLELVWAQNVVEHSNKPVLLLAPLAVTAQTIREAEKFGIETIRSNDGKVNSKKIIVTNYEKLHHFNPNDFAGVVCDESSIIKNFDGQTTGTVTEFLRTMQYRLLATATASPNDYIELGTSAEALGEMGRMDMLSMFFKNDENSNHPIWWGARWRFKAHAEQAFWRWVVSWSRSARMPSDLGYDNGDFLLPKLIEQEHIVEADIPRDGMLFDMPAVTLQEQREERRLTIQKRCDVVAKLVDHNRSAVVWSHLNDETDLLEKMISGAVQVSGSDSDEAKEEKFLAFSTGQARVMVTKPKIGAFGLNWQHCAHMTTFPSHSFEQYYQTVRRLWRFGQKHDVTVDIVTSKGEMGVMRNLQRKADAATLMFTKLVELMNNELKIDRSIKFEKKMEKPSWLS